MTFVYNRLEEGSIVYNTLGSSVSHYDISASATAATLSDVAVAEDIPKWRIVQVCFSN